MFVASQADQAIRSAFALAVEARVIAAPPVGPARLVRLVAEIAATAAVAAIVVAVIIQADVAIVMPEMAAAEMATTTTGHPTTTTSYMGARRATGGRQHYSAEHC